MRHALPMVTDCTDCGACCLEQAFLPVNLRTGATFTMEPCTPLPPELDAELQVIYAE